MNIARLKEFLQEVRNKTEDGTVLWKGTAEDDIFSAVVSQGRYILKSYGFTQYEDGDKLGPPSLGVYNKQNRLVVDITYATEDAEEETLKEIYLCARRKALGIEDAIEDILNSFNLMDDDIPF